MRLLYITLLLLSLTVSCRVGPRYTPPCTAVPDEWKAPDSQTAQAHFDNFWWEVFNDELLNELEIKAIENNPNLYVALEQVFEARAQAGVQAANLFPQFFIQPSYESSGQLFQIFLPKTLNIPGFPQNIQPFRIHLLQYLLPLNMSYELDLWGQLKDQYDSAFYHFEAQANAYCNVMLTLTADVASAYYQLRTSDKQIDLLKSTIETRQKNLQLTENRYNKGIITFLDVAQAEVDLANTENALEEATRLRSIAENQLAVLTGELASNFTLDHNPLNTDPPQIPADLPSTILLQRPDIAQLERTMASEHALVNAAYASFFPSFTLTGALGFLSPTTEDFLKWISRYWAFGASASQMVFDGGRDCSNLKASWARFLEASGSYQQQVLTAVREVEDALVNLEQQKKQEGWLKKAVSSSSKATQLSLKRYQQGVAIYLEVVENERLKLQAELNLNEIQGSLYLSTIQLIKAMGGSWSHHQLFQSSSEEPSSCTESKTGNEGHLPNMTQDNM